MPPKPSTAPTTQVTPSGTPAEVDPMPMGNLDRLSNTPDIPCPPLQLIRAHPAQHSLHPLSVTPWEPQRTHYEVTWQESPLVMVTPPPSEDRLSDTLLSPIPLQRMVDNGMPMRLSPANFPQPEDIAGSPVSSLVKPRCVTGRFFPPDQLHESQPSSPISSDPCFGPLPTPDFDSTGYVMRLAQPGDTALPLLGAQRACVAPALSTVAQRSWDGNAPPSPQAHPGVAVALPQRGEDLEDFDEHPVNFLHPALSRTLHDAWHTQMQTPSAFPPLPGSAPAALYRSTAEQHALEAQAALDSHHAAAIAGNFPVVQLVASQDTMH
jgi:hypothetical protein